jgi:hypothetical protein
VSGLRDLQRAVQRSVLLRDAGPALSIVADMRGAEARDRLGVYIHGYGARLADVLRNDFSGLSAMIGEDAFKRLAMAYIDAHPSREFNVRWYGADLAGFLGTTPPWSETPAMGEMARLDWAIGLCFDAPDEPCTEVKDLERLAPEQWPEFRFQLCRGVQRLRFKWNVGEIRRATDRGDTIPELADLPVHQGWIVSRIDTKIFHREVADDEEDALDTIASGGSFADVCEQLCRWHDADDVAVRAVILLRGWVENGWIARMQGNQARSGSDDPS